MFTPASDDSVRLLGNGYKADIWAGQCFIQRGQTWQIRVEELQKIFECVERNAFHKPGGVILKTPDSFPCFDAIKVFFRLGHGWTVMFIEITQSELRVHASGRLPSGSNIPGVLGDVAAAMLLPKYSMQVDGKDFIVEPYEPPADTPPPSSGQITIDHTINAQGKPVKRALGPWVQLMMLALNLPFTGQMPTVPKRHGAKDKSATGRSSCNRRL